MRSRVSVARCFIALLGLITSAGAFAQVPAPVVTRAVATITPEDLLREAFTAFRERLSLNAPLGPPSFGSGELRMVQRYTSHFGPVSMEVHQSDSATTVWIAVPRQMSAGTARIYIWYAFRPVSGGRFAPLRHPVMVSTPYVGPVRGVLDADYLLRTGRWSHGEEFGTIEIVNENDDPPHWSPILSPLEFTPERYARLHELMQDDATLGAARVLMDSAAPVRADLSDRVTLGWIPVTLRGFIRSGHVSTTDMMRDHSTDFVTDGDAPSGWLTDMSSGDSDWAGQDWIVHVRPDPDVRYISSVTKADRSFDVETEIEQFSLRLRQRYTMDDILAASRRTGIDATRMMWLLDRLKPQAPTPYLHRPGEWVQMTGRWVIDPGHTTEWEDMSFPLRAVYHHHGLDVRPTMKEFNTEIHPWELTVSSTTVGAVTQAKVLATGAWNGEDLTFAVYPPLRPSATARLRYRVHRADGGDGFDELVGARMEAVPWPAANPNHVVFRLVSSTSSPVVSYSTGRIGMARDRSVHAIVDAWWDMGPSDTRISGRVTTSDVPVANTRLLFRRTFARTSDDGAASLHWTDAAMRSGSFDQPADAGPYTLRPSSPDWDFASRMIDLRAGRPETVELPALRRRDVGAGLPGWTEPAFPGFGLEPAAAYMLYEQLVTPSDITSLSGGELVVAGSGLTYAKVGYMTVHFAGLARSSSDATAIRSADEAVESNARYRTPGIRPWALLGYPTRGVVGIRIRAQLLIRVRDTTWVVDDKEFATTEDGYAVIPFNTGSHAEDVAIAWQVVLNPFNSWFVPNGLTPWAHIVPGDDTDIASGSLPRFEGGRRPGLTRPELSAAPPIPVFSLRDSVWMRSMMALREEVTEKQQMSRMMSVIRGKRELKKPAAAEKAMPTEKEVPAEKAMPTEKAFPVEKTVAPEKEPGIMEAELLAKGSSASAGSISSADMSKSEVQWSGGAQLLWIGGSAGDRMTLRPLISVSGRYTMSGYFASGPRYCDFNVAVNGKAIGSIRNSSGDREMRSDKIVLGDVELKQGENEIAIQLEKGASPSGKAGSCSVGVDGFEFRPIK